MMFRLAEEGETEADQSPFSCRCLLRPVSELLLGPPKREVKGLLRVGLKYGASWKIDSQAVDGLDCFVCRDVEACRVLGALENAAQEDAWMQAGTCIRGATCHLLSPSYSQLPLCSLPRGEGESEILILLFCRTRGHS